MNATRICLCLAVSAILGLAADNRSYAQDRGRKPDVSSLRKKKDQPKEVRFEYIVTEYNPIVGGVVASQRLKTEKEANNALFSARRTHYVQWKFFGVNEPMRWRRFSSSFEAQAFIDMDGPSKSGALGIAILTGDTKAVPADVRLTKVPVTEAGESKTGNPPRLRR